MAEAKGTTGNELLRDIVDAEIVTSAKLLDYKPLAVVEKERLKKGKSNGTI